MRPLRTRLDRDLEQIADRATPSESAWANIRRRLESEADRGPAEVIELDSVDPSDDLRQRPASRKLLVAAAAVLIGVVIVATLVRQPSEEVLPAGPGPRAIVDAYVAAINRGDAGDAADLLAHNASLPFRADSAGSGHYMTVDEWRLGLEILTGQDARISNVECESDDGEEPGVDIRCTWRLHDAFTEVAGRPGDRVVTDVRVVDGEIVALDDESDWFNEDRKSFIDWIGIFRADDEEVLVWPPDLTPAEAHRIGERLAAYANEWAAWAAESE